MNETLKKWFMAALIRALKTILQSGAASACVLFIFEQFSWEIITCTAILAGLFSLLTSFVVLPEITK